MSARLLLCTIAVLFVSSLISVSGQTQQLTCGVAVAGKNYDFSTLTSDLTGTDATGFKYFLHICGSITTEAMCTNVNAAASSCQTYPADANFKVVAGLWETNPQIIFSLSGNTVSYSMTGLNKQGQPGGKYYTSIVNLVCAQAAGQLTVTAQGETQTYNYPTPLACGVAGPPPANTNPNGSNGDGDDGGKSGLSGGWIFIIILVVVIPLYIAGGCLYKHQKLGSAGIEKCPNIEFWRDLPSLAKDGCVFTWTKLRGLCGARSGAASGGSQSYEAM